MEMHTMNARQKRMKDKQRKALINKWIIRTVLTLGVIGAVVLIENRALNIMGDRTCKTATPAYAQQIGCGQ
jgi:hypothetical protein